MKDAPARYKHDCDTCIYMGHSWHLDLYFHPGATHSDRSVVARFGDDGPEYESGIGLHSMGVYVAAKRAVERGLMEESALEPYKRFKPGASHPSSEYQFPAGDG